MKTTHHWKSGNRLDSFMNALLVVLALGVLGVGAIDFDAGMARVTTQAQYQV